MSLSIFIALFLNFMLANPSSYAKTLDECFRETVDDLFLHKPKSASTALMKLKKASFELMELKYSGASKELYAQEHSKFKEILKNFDAEVSSSLKSTTKMKFVPDNDGQFNRGIYYFVEGSKPRVIKLLHDVNSVQEIRNAFLGEEIGGPHVYGAGFLKANHPLRYDVLESKSVPYLELEWLDYRNKDMFSIKACRRRPTLCIQRLNKYPKTVKSNLVNQSLDQLVNAFEHGVFPYDPDMVILASGEIRWIDSGNWIRPNEVRSDEVSDSTYNFITYLSHFEVASKEEIFQLLLSKLKKSKLSEAEKMFILEKLKSGSNTAELF